MTAFESESSVQDVEGDRIQTSAVVESNPSVQVAREGERDQDSEEDETEL